ncbi:hypothetical protein IM40_09685 (plasmid) [Candidatus Paracaedimonas acanthamoebae]|nr:hypothetical protein IM40_09685 [Candidatus Paracaedimonas acanthamoebae]
MSLSFILFSLNTCVYGSIDLTEYIPKPKIRHVARHTSQAKLQKSYKKMRKNMHLDELEDRAEKFKERIYDPVNMDNIGDQTEYISTLRDLKKRLDKVHPILVPYFEDHIDEIDNRLDLARLDLQLFNRRGVRGSFNHPLIPQNIQTSLSSIVGKIFHITQEEGEPEDVMDIGSGMMAKLINGKPSNIKNGDMLNGVMSCAHVLESGGDEHLIGVYFVAHDHLNPITGLPEDQINPVNSAQDLMQYLRTNPNSYEIDLYSIKRRTNLISIIEGNNVNATNPQYWSNEDIIFGTFKTVAHLYSHNTRIKFDTITADTPFKITKRRKPYFAAGYPGCSHYNKRKFRRESNYSLIKEIGLSPLHITSRAFAREE